MNSDHLVDDFVIVEKEDASAFERGSIDLDDDDFVSNGDSEPSEKSEADNEDSEDDAKKMDDDVKNYDKVQFRLSKRSPFRVITQYSKKLGPYEEEYELRNDGFVIRKGYQRIPYYESWDCYCRSRLNTYFTSNLNFYW